MFFGEDKKQWARVNQLKNVYDERFFDIFWFYDRFFDCYMLCYFLAILLTVDLPLDNEILEEDLVFRTFLNAH